MNSVKSYKTVTKGCKMVTKMIYCKYFIIEAYYRFDFS